MGFKFGGNGAYLLAGLMTQAPPLLFYLIRSSLKDGGGNGWCVAKVKVGLLFCGVTYCKCGG
jgi:hypothetical protein